MFVSDEETGGEVGAAWLCSEHPDAVRCDMLINEGAGEVFEFDGRRQYGVGCAEKGIFRFKLNADGEAGHASMPQLGDNALLKLAPVLTALADAPRSYTVTEAPARAAVRPRARSRRHPGARSRRSAPTHRGCAC